MVLRVRRLVVRRVQRRRQDKTGEARQGEEVPGAGRSQVQRIDGARPGDGRRGRRSHRRGSVRPFPRLVVARKRPQNVRVLQDLLAVVRPTRRAETAGGQAHPESHHALVPGQDLELDHPQSRRLLRQAGVEFLRRGGAAQGTPAPQSQEGPHAPTGEDPLARGTAGDPRRGSPIAPSNGFSSRWDRPAPARWRSAPSPPRACATRSGS